VQSSKPQIRNPKQILMSETRNPKRYDLEERTLEFSKRVIKFCKGLPRTVINDEIGKQLIRASTSVGANYIEANESLSKKDFLTRIKICRKEAKESGYWLKLIETNNSTLKNEQELALRESIELMKIFGSILTKSQ
jgi:four helix bundle protein